MSDMEAELDAVDAGRHAVESDRTPAPMTAPIPVPSLRQIWSIPSVRALMLVQLFWSIGAMAQFTALGKFVIDVTNRNLNLAFLGLAEFVPTAVLVLVSGTVVDRFDRRKVAGIGMVGEVLCAMALFLYIRTGPTAMWPIFVIVAGVGTTRAFVSPATRSMKPLVAKPNEFSRVAALFSISWQSAAIFGPAAAGFLYAAHRALPFAVTLTLYSLSIVSLFFVRFRIPQRRSTDDNQKVSVSHALQGLKFIRRSPVLLGAISLDLMAVLFGGAVALLPSIAKNQLHVGDIAYGWLRAAPGVGAVIIGLILVVKPFRRHVGRNLLLAVGVFGVATVALGLTHSYVVAFAALIVLSGADMISVYVRSTVVPLSTPNEMQGRVSSVENVFIGASNELGAFESGVASSIFGLTPAVAGGGVITVAVAVMWAVFFPSLRSADRFEDVAAEANPQPH